MQKNSVYNQGGLYFKIETALVKHIMKVSFFHLFA
jgi:hypothetical protein